MAFGLCELLFTFRWGVTLVTAVTMAVINFFTIWIISFAVSWKFSTLQADLVMPVRLRTRT